MATHFCAYFARYVYAETDDPPMLSALKPHVLSYHRNTCPATLLLLHTTPFHPFAPPLSVTANNSHHPPPALSVPSIMSPACLHCHRYHVSLAVMLMVMLVVKDLLRCPPTLHVITKFQIEFIPTLVAFVLLSQVLDKLKLWPMCPLPSAFRMAMQFSVSVITVSNISRLGCINIQDIYSQRP